jgi:hypothetical protein
MLNSPAISFSFSFGFASFALAAMQALSFSHAARLLFLAAKLLCLFFLPLLSAILKSPDFALEIPLNIWRQVLRSFPLFVLRSSSCDGLMPSAAGCSALLARNPEL